MPEKTKRNKDFQHPAKKEVAQLPVERPENNARDTWETDQREKSYYYDDSYGYEIYNPDEEEDEE